ncbi:hypothetical protein ABB37_09641 [Leptomonas pyrrhocoris]|uniref:Uncharacterized protein n=1 Tax=Leptomonas pyrrhocoris TaxID=157538 RepID=A0A0N0DR75_LEPPY|nr:hypothetical protein ABB37_09641 [Leptomonas pyrrhocoris]KPA73731.1 hypothetical protein ABB37_09641 [Leptomonas pyrrhocoris]|eukprot:XP_015652170.1 hypothetical protein ABB37_09641 [Leptomonas pyrrhocoris]
MPPPPQPKKPAHRTPLDIDHVAIDFSTVKPSPSAAAAPPAASASPAVIPGLLELMQQEQQQQADGRQAVSDVRAFDPSLQGVAQRQLSGAGLAASRRKKVFGGQPFVPPSAATTTTDAVEVNVNSKNGDVSIATSALKQTAPIGETSGAAAVPATPPPVQPSSDPAAAAAQDALDFLIAAQVKLQQQSSSSSSSGFSSDLQKRREMYAQQLRDFCQRGRRPLPPVDASSSSASATTPPPPSTSSSATVLFPNTSTSHTNSLLRRLFADGVPDVEPWDRWTSAAPRYGDAKHLIVNPLTATPAQVRGAQLDLLHHPVIPDSHYTRHYQHRDLEQPVLVTVAYKTKAELRAERRERLKEKQAKKQRQQADKQEMAAADAPTSSLAASSSAAARQLLHDRLSTKNLALNLFAASVLNPLAADTTVLQQYELRDLEHQRRNHERHVAALPNQILKRERDQQRYATEHPLLRAYRIYPIYGPAHLGKLRHYANDNLLRGFVLYVAECDAVVVLAGGEKAVRHLDQWILQKMVWEHHDTRAHRLATVPLMDAESFSFHLPKAQPPQGGGGRVYKQGKLMEGASATADPAAREAVFIKMAPSVEEGERFLRELPAPSSPWTDLSAIWRTAFLQDGLQSEVGREKR